jgi:methanobactin biosynthesis MbnP-like protein
MKALFRTLLIILLLIACESGNVVSLNAVDVEITCRHHVDGNQLMLDQLVYSTAIGQAFSVKTVKYFISNIKLYKEDNTIVELPDIHFVDIRLPETVNFILSEKIPTGNYSGLSFVYGLTPEENITGRFSNPPESLMEWPEPLGGGYHYAKIEGQYIAADNFFNFHTGMLDGTDYSIPIDLNTPFTISANGANLELNMEIQNWFTGPNNWDFTVYSSGIMGNHEAQKAIQENGADVFNLDIDQTN